MPEHWLVDRVARFNLLVAATNLLPWRWGASASDGWHLVRRIGSGGLGEIAPHRAALDKLATRQSALGSALGLFYAELCLAWIDLVVGRTERAADFFARNDDVDLRDEPWIDALYHYVHAAWHRAARRPLPALHGIRRETRWYQEGKLAAEANDLLTLAEAWALVDLDATSQARQVLARVAGVGGTIGREAAAVQLACSVAEDRIDVLRLSSRRVAERIDGAFLDPAAVVELLWMAAELLAEAGHLDDADRARRASRRLAVRTLARADTEDRGTLAHRLGEPGGGRPLGGLTSRA